MKRSLPFLTVLALCAATVLSCSAGADEADPLRTALRPEWFQFEADHRVDGDDRLVVLVGENHASVRGQVHLAALLEQLLDAKLIDAILVEGSEGPIDVHDFDSQMVKLLPRDELNRHWRGQLDWGQIAGWEYVALTRPQTPAQGVEDMAAKTRFFITDLTGSNEDVQRQIESWKRGAVSLENATAALEQAGIAQPKARPALDAYRKQLGEYASTAQSFARQRQPVVALQLELLKVGEQLEELFKSTGLAELRGKKDAEDLFQKRVEQLAVEQPAQIARLSELLKRYEKLKDDLGGPDEEIGRIAKSLAHHGEVAEDSYFTLANQLRAAAEARWGRDAGAWPPDVAKALGSVDSFFHDEAERQREESRTRSRQHLADRDRAMARNTERFLSENPHRRVVLIVGSAHLEGMAAELGTLGLPFVRGRLLPEESEPWEEEAWERRRQVAEEVFEDQDYKEVSRLLDPAWLRDQLARARKLSNSPEEKPKAAPGKDTSVVRNSLLADQRTPRGPQVVDYGPVPGSPGEIYEIWDRLKSRGYVKSLSDGLAQFVYGFQQKNKQGKLQYILVTSQGDRTLNEFRETPPGEKGKRPRYVVNFYEPDYELENTIPYSPFWRLLAGSGGGGGKIPNDPRKASAPEDSENGKGNDHSGNDNGQNETGNDDGGNKKPPFWTAYWPHDRERPRMVRTNNPELARGRIDRIGEQKALEPSEVEIFDDPVRLRDARFAERNGTNAGMVVLLAKNNAELRAAVSEAAVRHKLVNKQVVLITCGDVFPETASLRELLLGSGALMVWTPDRQITPSAGEKLKARIETALKESETGEKFRDIDELTNQAIWDLLRAEPGDPDLPVLLESGSWVELSDPAPLGTPDTGEERHA
jgi:hypothetical protein